MAVDLTPLEEYNKVTQQKRVLEETDSVFAYAF